MRKALFLAIAGCFFFTFSFVLNRQMNLSGGSWLWSASLRYIFMLPILLVMTAVKKELKDVLKHISKNLMQWIIWSTVGFGVFYINLTLASTYGPSWMVSGTWQFTIIAGALLSPLFYVTVETEEGVLKKRAALPKKSLLMSVIILVGIFFIQLQQAQEVSWSKAAAGIVPIFIGAFAYPLGNRKMMELCDGKLNTIQRVFGMTLTSMPIWILLSLYAKFTVGLPGKGQVIQVLIVAVFSGIIATILFFKATDLVREDTYKLAVVETTQASQVIFTLLEDVIILKGKVPAASGFIGIFLVVIGMVFNSLIGNTPKINGRKYYFKRL